MYLLTFKNLIRSSGDYSELQTASNLTCWNFKLFRTQICSPFQTPLKTPNFKPPNTSWFDFKFGHFCRGLKKFEIQFWWRNLALKVFDVQLTKFKAVWNSLYLGSTQYYKTWKQQFYTIQYLLLLLILYTYYTQVNNPCFEWQKSSRVSFKKMLLWWID